MLTRVRLKYKQEMVLQLSHVKEMVLPVRKKKDMSYGPSWAHYLGGYQDRLLGPLGLLDLACTAPVGVKRKDLGGEVLG
jgi:hypothetical protein